jgi:ABC-type glycerol-3-phosphate transport system substrate-binding protein
MLPVLLVAALTFAPLGAQAADLVVWWDQGVNREEDAAVREVIAAFEQESGKQVELVFHPFDEHPAKLRAAIQAGRPPDFGLGFLLTSYVPKWALEDRLVDLSEAIGHFSDLFDPYQLDRAKLLNRRSNDRSLYGLPIGHVTDLIFVWKSLLQQAGSLRTSPKTGRSFGRSGAIRSSLQFARRYGAMIFGGSACLWRPRLTTLSTSFSSSWLPTGQTT